MIRYDTPTEIMGIPGHTREFGAYLTPGPLQTQREFGNWSPLISEHLTLRFFLMGLFCDV